MSDTPSPQPESLKPKLSLTPKAPASSDSSAGPAPTLSAPPPSLGSSNSNVTPAGLSAPSGGAPRPAFKLQGNVHPANPDKFTDAKFQSAIPSSDEDAPAPAIVALSALAAVAAISFAVLLFLKNQ